jgi:regulatory protein
MTQNPEPTIEQLRKQIEEVDGSGFFTPETKAQRQAVNRLLHQLSRGGKSEQQLRDYLVSKETEPEFIDVAIERVRSMGLIDDDLLASSIVRVRSEVHRHSSSRIRQQLRSKKLAASSIEKALASIDSTQEALQAAELAIRRAKSLKGLESQVAMRRLVGFLQRRGYAPSVAFSVARDALSAEVKSTSDEQTDL